jgi:hypothetical protein
MPQLAGRTRLCHSTEDQILMISDVVNGEGQLGQSGPLDKVDTQTFPPDIFRFVYCAGMQDPVEERKWYAMTSRRHSREPTNQDRSCLGPDGVKNV